jgi:hypothetical protein
MEISAYDPRSIFSIDARSWVMEFHLKHAWVCIALLTIASAGVCANPQLDTGASAEPSFDGLLPLKKTKVRKVWVREGFDLSGYTKLKLGGAVIQYRPVKETTARASSSQREFPLSDSAKEKLQEIIFEEFQKALEKLERYEIVESSGPDVLTVRGALLAVVSRVPPERPGRTDYYLSAWNLSTPSQMQCLSERLTRGRWIRPATRIDQIR